MRCHLCALVVLLAACETPASLFLCEKSAQCQLGAEQGVCEASGTCSFNDTTCSSGRRYGKRSGSLSDSCVDESLPVDASIVPSVDAAAADAESPVDAGVDVAITCVGDWIITPEPLGTGSIMRARYTDSTPWVYIGFEIDGPGTGEIDGAVVDGGGSGYSWYTDFTVDTPGVWTMTFTRDMGVAGAACMFAVADTGAPPPLP